MLSTVTKERLLKKFGAANSCYTKEEDYLEIPDIDEQLSDNRMRRNIPKIDNINYQYQIEDFLEKTSSVTGTTIAVCLYRINMGGMLPFVEYMMYRYSKKNDNLIIFPTYPRANRSIKTALNDFKKDIIEDSSISFTIKGCLKHENMSFIFVKLPSIKTTTTVEDKPSNQFIWVTISEIVNLHHVYGNPIHSSATQLFCDNPRLTEITTSKGVILESPEVFYHGDKYEKIIYESVFGLAKATPYASLGPFYYMGSFNNAMNYIFNTKLSPSIAKKHSIGGILRCIVFVGKLKVMMNKKRYISNKYIDIALIKDPKDQKYIHSTRYMRDNAGEWASKYNSVIAGRVPLKGGGIYKKEPQLAVRTYQQQLPVSYRIFK